jgi:hypothetical protein
LLGRTEPENAIAPATRNEIPVSSRVILDK